MDPIDIRYSLSLDGYLAACRAHWHAHRQGNLLHGSAGVIGLGIGIYVLTFNQVWGVLFLTLSGLLLLLTWLRGVLCRQGYQQSRKYTQPIRVVFSEETIHVESAEGVSDLKWSAYSRFHVAPRFILLYLTKRSFSVIPREAFADAAEEQRFLSLLEAKLSPLR